MVRVPMHKFGKLEELVGAAVFPVSAAASYVTGHLCSSLRRNAGKRRQSMSHRLS
jgi:NAD(P)-dependent dehydrogenase (short-subunit alcohol dehydrogenase family)